MVLPAAEAGVFLRALTGGVMGMSANNSVGSVQTRSESKHRGGQADGGNISHHTGNEPAAARLPHPHPHPWLQSGGDVLGQPASLMYLILQKTKKTKTYLDPNEPL